MHSRIERFMSQPFLVAEVFTGKAGQYTKLPDTIRSFKEICEGQMGSSPRGSLHVRGGHRTGRRASQEDECLGAQHPVYRATAVDSN